MPPPPDFVNLYRRAFAEYGTRLWNKRMHDAPTQDDALVVARALRIEGDREARRLAEQIDQACRATLQDSGRGPSDYVTPRNARKCKLHRGHARWLRGLRTYSLRPQASFPDLG